MRTQTLRIAVVALVAALVGGAAVAWADHQWSDVPTGSFFHDSIGAITDAGCAVGYGDGTFQPDRATTRGQFTYWLNNCGGRLAYDQGTDNFSVSDADAASVATASLTSGAKGTGTANVLAIATISVGTSGDQQSTWTLDRSTGGGSVTADQATVSVVTPGGATTDPTDTLTLMAAEVVPAGSTVTFSVSGTRVSGVPLANIEVDLAVTSYPFDGTGEAGPTPP
jgi:hypothetical protein